MARRMKATADTPPDVLAKFEEFRKTQLGRQVPTDPPRGVRVRDLPADAQHRFLAAALDRRKRMAPPADWCHKLDPEAVEW